MKFVNVLPLAVLSTAFVLPPEHVLSEIAIEDHHGESSWLDDAVAAKDDILSSFKQHFEEVTGTSKNAWNEITQSSKSALDIAFEKAGDAADTLGDDAQSWASELIEEFDEPHFDALEDPHHGPPYHGPPHHDDPKHGKPDHGKRPHHGPPHHHKSNLTVYQMIAESKYTTKLKSLIEQYDDLVEALNSTKANYTVFAPTDKAFEKIPEHAPVPTKEQIKAILQYHVVDGFYPAGRVLSTHTAPTLLKGKHLSSEPEPQRVAFKFTLRGLTVNFYSRIVAVNIFGTNGVIHGVDSLILPPPSLITLVDLFPGEFSTFELGLGKTGLLDEFNTTHHPGGTLFAPNNFAFQKLGPKINAFLFSKYGNKYLKALLEYHAVPGTTLYSDAVYQAKLSDENVNDFPKGFFHLDLPTFLKDRSLSVDIARYGGFISIKINGFVTVAVQDGIAEDGVLHVVRDVLIPPKKVGSQMEQWSGEDLTVEDLKERLEPFVHKSDL